MNEPTTHPLIFIAQIPKIYKFYSASRHGIDDFSTWLAYGTVVHDTQRAMPILHDSSFYNSNRFDNGWKDECVVETYLKTLWILFVSYCINFEICSGEIIHDGTRVTIEEAWRLMMSQRSRWGISPSILTFVS